MNLNTLERRLNKKDKVRSYFVENIDFLLGTLIVAIFIFIAIIISQDIIADEELKSKNKFFEILPHLITALAILISALFASIFARENIDKGRSNIKLQETLKFITNVELDKEYIASKNAWAEFRLQEDHGKAFQLLFTKYHIWGSNSGGFDKFSSKCQISNESKSNKDLKSISEQYQFVMTYFNYFELIALGIEEGIIDEEFYKKWYGSGVISVWNYSVEGIGALKVLRSNPRLYLNWQKLVKKWEPIYGTAKEVPVYSFADLIIALDDHIVCAKKQKENDD